MFVFIMKLRGGVDLPTWMAPRRNVSDLDIYWAIIDTGG